MRNDTFVEPVNTSTTPHAIRLLLAVVTVVALMLTPTSATAVPPDTAPTKVQIHTVEPNSAKMRWQPPTAKVDVAGYTVSWSTKGKIIGTVETTPDSRFASFENLTEQTTYTVKVAAFNKRKQSYRPVTVTFTTLSSRLEPSVYAAIAGRVTQTTLSERKTTVLDNRAYPFAGYRGGIVYQSDDGSYYRVDGRGKKELPNARGAARVIGADDQENAYFTSHDNKELFLIDHDGAKKPLFSSPESLKFSIAPNGIVMAAKSRDDHTEELSTLANGKLTDTRLIQFPGKAEGMTVLSNGATLWRVADPNIEGYMWTAYVAPEASSVSSRLSTHPSSRSAIGIADDNSVYVAEADTLCSTDQNCSQDRKASTITKFVDGVKTQTIPISGLYLNFASIYQRSYILDVAPDGRIFAATDPEGEQWRLVEYAPSGGAPTVIHEWKTSYPAERVEVH